MLKSMLQHLRDTRAAELEGEGAGEAGFTLIELMVVLLIIAILLAIAIPTFLGVTGGANDRAAQSNLTNASTEVQAVYQNNGQAYPDSTSAIASYTSAAPEFSWVSTASAKQGVVSVSTFNVVAATGNDEQGIALAVMSKTGNCWFVVNEQQTPGANTPAGAPTLAGTYYAEAKKGATTTCSASNADGATAPTGGTVNGAAGPNGWGDSYSTAGTFA